MGHAMKIPMVRHDVMVDIDSMGHRSIFYLPWDRPWQPVARSMGYATVCPMGGPMLYPPWNIQPDEPIHGSPHGGYDGHLIGK